MKRTYLFLALMGLLSLTAHAQTITSVTVNPTPVLDCSTTVVTVNGDLLCINAVINGTTSSIVGSTIFVDVDMFQPPICLPAIGTYSESVSVGNIPAGTYTLTARTILNGALANTASQPLTVGSCCPTNGNFVASDDKFCPGEMGTFTAIDPSLASYTWYVDGAAVGGNTAQLMYTFSNPGTYSVSLRADDGICADSTFQSVEVDSPSIQFGTITDESCAGSQDGGVAVSISGGFGPIVYSWSNGSSQQDLSQVGAGTYTLSVTDDEGCTSQGSVVVGLDTTVTVEITSPLAVAYCAGDTLQLAHTHTGATTIQWQVDGQAYASSDTVWIPLQGGNVMLQAIATDGVCADTMSIMASVADSLKLSALVTGEACADEQNGSIDLSTSGGLAPFTFVWDHGPVTEDVSELDTGTYVVSVMGEAGCMAQDSFVISTLGGIVASFGFSTADTVVSFTDLSSPFPSSWVWDFGDGSVSTDASPSHTYADSGFYGVCLAVADEFGCMDTFCQNVAVTIAVGVIVKKINQLTLAPNPASEVLYIHNLPSSARLTNIVVRDAMGRILWREASFSGRPIPVGSLANGLYTVELEWQGERWTGKFLKR